MHSSMLLESCSDFHFPRWALTLFVRDCIPAFPILLPSCRSGSNTLIPMGFWWAILGSNWCPQCDCVIVQSSYCFEWLSHDDVLSVMSQHGGQVLHCHIRIPKKISQCVIAGPDPQTSTIRIQPPRARGDSASETLGAAGGDRLLLDQTGWHALLSA